VRAGPNLADPNAAILGNFAALELESVDVLADGGSFFWEPGGAQFLVKSFSIGFKTSRLFREGAHILSPADLGCQFELVVYCL
jgi:hypothetical protein